MKKTDYAAKSPFDLPSAKVSVPYNDFKHCTSQYILFSWQDDWNDAVVKKLLSVNSILKQMFNYVCFA